jgi:molybdenum cofactor biosynthesis enzyme MoaA
MELVRAQAELSTADWKRVISEARDLGVLQLGLSGGEPLVRPDVETVDVTLTFEPPWTPDRIRTAPAAEH